MNPAHRLMLSIRLLCPLMLAATCFHHSPDSSFALCIDRPDTSIIPKCTRARQHLTTIHLCHLPKVAALGGAQALGDRTPGITAATAARLGPRLRVEVARSPS